MYVGSSSSLARRLIGYFNSTFSNSLKTGGIYLGKYIFTDKPVLEAKESNMSEEDINKMLDNDRLEEKNVKEMGRKITIQNINTNEIKSFNSISNCVIYLNNIAPSNKSTLYRYIELKKPYHGFICK